MLDRIDRTVEHAWHATFLHDQVVHGGSEPALALMSPTWDEETFEAWFRRQRLDAVITNHTAALEWMRAVGADVPGSAGFAHLDWSEAMTSCAGVDQNTEQVGSAAVDLVARQVHYSETGVPAFQKTLLVKGRWVEGTTVRGPGESPPESVPSRRPNRSPRTRASG